MRCPRTPPSTATPTRTRPARRPPRPRRGRGCARRASRARARASARANRRRARRRRARDRVHPSRDLRYPRGRMPGASGGSGKRVIIGEEDERIAVLLRDAINDEPGYQAFIVPDGRKIEDAVREGHTDLLILDIMMPGLSGFEIYDRLRAHAGTQRMPILFISAAVG